jgi:hypothetical protein
MQEQLPSDSRNPTFGNASMLGYASANQTYSL